MKHTKRKPAPFRLLNEETTLVPIDSVQPHERNVNQADLGAIIESVRVNGFYGSLIVHKSSGKILAGKHRWKAAKEQGATEVPVTFIDVDDATALRILLADNRTTRLGLDEPNALAALLQEIQADAGTLEGTGYDAEALDDLLRELGDGILGSVVAPAAPQPTLSDRFLVPPFSVLDARQGYWQERKRAWLALGIQSEIGRDGGGERPTRYRAARQCPSTGNGGASPGGSPRPACDYSKKQRGDGAGRPIGG